MNTSLSSGWMPGWWMPAVLLCCVLLSPPAEAGHSRDDAADLFYRELAPYGNWVHHKIYGRVWYPRQVSRGWRPYTDGYWDYTNEYGWVWVSDWVWGWAPFHYGRWVWDDWYGWVWVPGTVWAPAWVFWRYGGGYASWAPMPPQYIWNPYIYANYAPYYFDYDRYVPWHCWVSVHERDFPVRRKPARLIAPDRNREILKATTPVDRITVKNNTLVNQGIPVSAVEKVIGKRIKPVAPRVLTEFKPLDPQVRTRKKNRELTIYRPIDTAPSPDLIRREEQKAREIGERLALQPYGGRGRSAQSGRYPDDPGLPGRLSGKPILLDYQDAGGPALLVPDRTRQSSPLLTIPESPDEISIPIEEGGKSLLREEQKKTGVPKLDRKEAGSRQESEVEKKSIGLPSLEQNAIRQQEERARLQQLELDRQQQIEQKRLEQELVRQQEMQSRQMEMERQREAEAQRMEQDAIRQQEERTRLRQLELDRQQQIEQQRLDRELMLQQEMQSRQMELERQREAEAQRMEQEERTRLRQLELDRQQQIEQQRLDRELMLQQEMQRQQSEFERQQRIEQQRINQELMYQQEMQRRQQEIMRPEVTEQQQTEQAPAYEQSGRTRGSRSVIRGDRHR